MGVSSPRVRTLCTLVLGVLLLAPLPADAQYFGRNKVEYEDFDFRILQTQHFDIYYYPREERAARLAAGLAERWYARLSSLLNHTFDRRQPLVLYASQADFSQTNVVSGMLSDSIGGVTEGARRRIVMPFAPTLAETERVMGHELVHAFQFDIARLHGSDTAQPLWFIEGMAEYLSRGSLVPESTLWLRDAVLSERLPETVGAAAHDVSPYLFGHAFWSYLGGRFGDDIIEKALKPGKKQRRLKDRMRHATGAELDELYRQWRGAVQEQYAGGAEGRSRYPVWSRESMQAGPAVAPDGRRAVFFSERDRLSLDLFLADLRTGKVIRKLATTMASAKFDSLQPLRSAGAWSPDGHQFAFAAVKQGRASLFLVDVDGGTADREIVFPSVGQVLSLTWSPDGRSIAFAAIAGGWTDLYVTDVTSGALRQLTDDAVADWQPAWSHDGRRLAFVTERFSSDLATLRIGAPRIATLELGTNEMRPVEAAATTPQLNPQWSADDQELYFIGHVAGAANVLRVNLHTAALRQITNVSTGVSGVTPTGPALSVSADESTIAFTVYRNGRPRLVVLDGADAVAGARALDDGQVAFLPDEPVADEGSFGRVTRALADHATGLPPIGDLRSLDYKPRLALEGVGQTYLSSGGGPFGTFVHGGGAIMFGDMLGTRTLGAAVQVSTHLRDTAFALRFLNQERRWSWGAVAELEPGGARYLTTHAVDHDGETALVRRTGSFRRVQMRAAAIVAYPFSRGLRFEFRAGAGHAAYRRDDRTSLASAATGEVLDRDPIESSGSASTTTVAEVGGALVHDTTVLGPTGPLVGSRYRLEVAPAVGQLSYTTVIADVRRYLMPVRPFTLALRAMHAGRYGGDGSDPRLMPSYLGSSYFVRGYHQDLRYCRPEATRTCGDELLGNRMLVGNVEVRFPVWGLLSRQLEYGMFPLDAFVFADGGMISAPAGPRTGISSIGGGLRANASGFPLEVAAVRALDGPRPRWQFDLGFRVGF